MEKRRDPQSAPGTAGRIVSVAGHLTPIQQAWSDYVTHGLKCPRCRSLDGGRCREAEQLHGAYLAAGDQAYDQLAGETP